MTNPIIETDLATVLNKLDEKLDNLDRKFDERLDNLDKKFEQKLENLDKKLDTRFNKIDDRLNKLEVGQSDLKGEIKSLDTKVEQLDKRIANQEFTNRGVLVGLILVMFGGLVKLFELWNF